MKLKSDCVYRDLCFYAGVLNLNGLEFILSILIASQNALIKKRLIRTSQRKTDGMVGKFEILGIQASLIIYSLCFKRGVPQIKIGSVWLWKLLTSSKQSLTQKRFLIITYDFIDYSSQTFTQMSIIKFIWTSWGQNSHLELWTTLPAPSFLMFRLRRVFLHHVTGLPISQYMFYMSLDRHECQFKCDWQPLACDRIAVILVSFCNFLFKKCFTSPLQVR